MQSLPKTWASPPSLPLSGRGDGRGEGEQEGREQHGPEMRHSEGEQQETQVWAAVTASTLSTGPLSVLPNGEAAVSASLAETSG